jgi:hypothetical protein
MAPALPDVDASWGNWCDTNPQRGTHDDTRIITRSSGAGRNRSPSPSVGVEE